ncbi:MAG: 50S ribosomal protein L15 [Gemmatimonadales bacterium]|nr:50S ribosomal protein L15 [Gemmatimonadales bacterium]MDZ4258202.1 50S ribosomal protein L15 [Gemmatimonadales bacterium]MDZ4388261.1 50S ribosomal protein L15 [Gemmatimonadales bacterium]
MTLSNLRPAPGSTRNRKRIGRGPGSGTGKTSGKGHKGSKARSGGATNPGFEGGQMPLYRRLPKRGFTNPFKITYLAVNLSALEKVSGDEITPATLFAAGILKNVAEPVKLLGHGDVARALVVRDIPVSASAKAKIEAAGGRVEA